MSGARKNTRTHVEIDGQRFLLDTDRDLVEVMERIEAAARSEPAFVHLSGGDHLISVLVSPDRKRSSPSNATTSRNRKGMHLSTRSPNGTTDALNNMGLSGCA